MNQRSAAVTIELLAQVALVRVDKGVGHLGASSHTHFAKRVLLTT
jgi:hypothetical protein